MERLELDKFLRYPLMSGMDGVQTDEYMTGLYQKLDALRELPLHEMASRLHDLFLAEAAMICMGRADTWHAMYWRARTVNDPILMSHCEQLRDEAVDCRDTIRRYLHHR